jgi:ubiquinone/menaquinone biosynthesis C-methylase UbiE
MRSEFWRNFWDKSAREHEDVRFISGWGNRTFQEMLFAITDVAKKLELRSEDRLLNVGCGAGLFEIAYAHWVKEIYGVDYSEEMVKVAKRNTEKYDNIIIKHGDMQNLPFAGEFFDKVLANTVIQYLNNLNEVKKTFREIKRVTKKQARILVSMNPDVSKKNDYIKGYYKLNLPQKEIKKKIRATNKALWFDKNELKNIGEKIGFKTEVLEMDRDVWQSKYYFDLLLVKSE